MYQAQIQAERYSIYACIPYLWLQIVDLSEINFYLLANFVDIDFWQSYDAECIKKL